MPFVTESGDLILSEAERAAWVDQAEALIAAARPFVELTAASRLVACEALAHSAGVDFNVALLAADFARLRSIQETVSYSREARQMADEILPAIDRGADPRHALRRRWDDLTIARHLPAATRLAWLHLEELTKLTRSARGRR